MKSVFTTVALVALRPCCIRSRRSAAAGREQKRPACAAGRRRAVPHPRRAGEQQQQLSRGPSASLAGHPRDARQHARDPRRLGTDRAGRGQVRFLVARYARSRRRARNNVRLDLLWFGTWKNTSPSYAPEWVKTDNKRFPRMIMKDGKTHYVLSPNFRTTLEADKRAFAAMMRHIREIDPDHIVILVQVENEVGSYGNPRDFSPEANRLFAGPVPAELARKTGKSGTWSQVFDRKADHGVQRLVYRALHRRDRRRRAGRARSADVLSTSSPATRPTPKAAKAAARVAAPTGPCSTCGRPPRRTSRSPRPTFTTATTAAVTASSTACRGRTIRCSCRRTATTCRFARFFWLALGKGAIGWTPFGMDPTVFQLPARRKGSEAENLDAFASKFALLAPISRDWARLAFEHPTVGFAKADDGVGPVCRVWAAGRSSSIWAVGLRRSVLDVVKFAAKPEEGSARRWRGDRAARPRRIPGRRIGRPHQFRPRQAGARREFQIVDVEEGTFENGRWVMSPPLERRPDRLWT